ncbi:MAG TPA: hypothetical protein PLV13_07670 [Ilumatobacteraceae bacterium]|nr:hypothetical protein [Ilumatobacteraceae bacterium]
MRTRVALLALSVAVPSLVAACGSDGSGGATTTSWPLVTVTTTSVPDSTTPESSSSTSSSTTSSTTTTMPPAVTGLELSAEGLGNALFGAGDSGVLAYVRAILGDPSDDSGWIDPFASGHTCSGSEVRFVRWDDLMLTFSDDSPAGSGYRHFAGYSYGPAADTVMNPYGLETEGGIGVGDSVDNLKAVYPGVLVNGADELSGPSFFIQDGLMGFLTGTSGDDTIISFVGGWGCGE